MGASDAAPHNPNQNHLLAALPTAEFERLAPHLELVTMSLGEVLYESGGQLQHVYFPTTSILSIHYVMEDGSSDRKSTRLNSSHGYISYAVFCLEKKSDDIRRECWNSNAANQLMINALGLFERARRFISHRRILSD